MFPLKFGSEVKTVAKIVTDEFTPLHHEIITQVQYEAGNLVLPDPRWASIFLGAGEEKAVFCICDQNNRVFALEAINERNYLNGRFVGGHYFFETRVPGLKSVKLDPDSLLGLTFTGLVKIREFVYGYEWGRFQFDPRKQGRLDLMLTTWLQSVFASQFNHYRSRYKDVHDRNVMFEIRTSKEKGAFIAAKDWLGRLKFCKVGLQPIDVR
jgi:hypothetical protein